MVVNYIINMQKIINKIICADCLDILPKIPDKSIDLIVTDPPYNLAYSGRGTKKTKFEKFANDNLQQIEYEKWFFAVCKQMHRVLKDDTAMYVFIDWRNYPALYRIISNFFQIKNCIVWAKDHFGLGYAYRFQHEFIIYAIKGRPKLNTKEYLSDVWRIKKYKEEYAHPTQKPEAIMALPILHSSQENDIVLDPFVGSGTTALAARNLERRFVGIEIDENYAKLAEHRLKQLTLNI